MKTCLFSIFYLFVQSRISQNRLMDMDFILWVTHNICFATEIVLVFTTGNYLRLVPVFYYEPFYLPSLFFFLLSGTTKFLGLFFYLPHPSCEINYFSKNFDSFYWRMIFSNEYFSVRCD